MDSDLALALKLQKELDEEYVKDRANDEYYVSKKKMSFLDIPGEQSSKISLIDPSLEYSDPTPDVHKMFLNFDRRFFWSSLGSVEVMWSPRMTRCAGICRYRSRNGATTIHLSLPLLKLRPRKDLVETLLHEMIHAYLFVTKNNKDRDGHGPEFQSHMHRINKSAGTHITIYHSFHAEVNVYKTHWWRCNGPCQYQKPFYGMVKRSMNRAPGPYDFWYADHQRNCGGEFVKVKEPENFKSNKKTNKYSQKGKEGNQSPSKMKTLQNYFHKVNAKPQIQNFGSRTFTKNGAFTQTKVNMSTKTKSETPSNTNTKVTGSTKGVVTMSNLKDNEQGDGSSSQQISSTKQDIIPFSGKGFTTGKTTASIADKPWLKRFDTISPSTNSSKGSEKSSIPSRSCLKPFDTSPSTSSAMNLNSCRKSLSSISLPSEGSKKMKLNNSNGGFDYKDDCELCTVACPICNKSVKASEINEHLDLCLRGSFETEDVPDSKCCACNQTLGRRSDVPMLCSICEEGACSVDFDVVESQNDDSFIVCPMCEKNMTSGDLERHLEICIVNEEEGQNQTRVCDEQDNEIIVLD